MSHRTSILDGVKQTPDLPFYKVQPNNGADLIQAIAAYKGEKEIHLPKGTYAVNQKITVDVAGLILRGVHKSLVHVDFGANGKISIEKATDIDLGGEISGITFDGQTLATKGITSEDMGVGKRIRNLDIHHCRFDNFNAVNAVAINLKNPELCWIRYNDLVQSRNILVRMYEDGYAYGNCFSMYNFYYPFMTGQDGIGLKIEQNSATHSPANIQSIGDHFYGDVARNALGISILNTNASHSVNDIKVLASRFENARAVLTTITAGAIRFIDIGDCTIYFSSPFDASLVKIIDGCAAVNCHNNRFERGGGNAIKGYEDAATGTNYEVNILHDNHFRYFNHAGSGSLAWAITGTAVEHDNKKEA